MANWRKTRFPGVYVSHSTNCPAYSDPAARCRCTPSWRGRRRHPVTGKPEWQKPVVKHRAEVLSWLAGADAGSEHLREVAARGPLFEDLADQWFDGVEQGRIGRRRGKGKAYAETTILAMGRSLKYHVLPVFGPQHAAEITELEWQRWIDQLARGARSRSTIAKHISVASEIYAWASAPSRRLVPRNPLRLVERHRTTRSRASASPWRPRRRRCSPRSTRRTASRTRSPSTPRCSWPPATPSRS